MKRLSLLFLLLGLLGFILHLQSNQTDAANTLPMEQIDQMTNVRNYNGIIFQDHYNYQADSEGSMAVLGNSITNGAFNYGGAMPFSAPSQIGVAPLDFNTALLLGGTFQEGLTFATHIELGNGSSATNPIFTTSNAGLISANTLVSDYLGRVSMQGDNDLNVITTVLKKNTQRTIDTVDSYSPDLTTSPVYTATTAYYDSNDLYATGLLEFYVSTSDPEVLIANMSEDSLSELHFTDALSNINLADYKNVIIRSNTPQFNLQALTYFTSSSIVPLSVCTIAENSPECDFFRAFSEKAIFYFPNASLVSGDINNHPAPAVFGSLVAPNSETRMLGGSINGLLISNDYDQQQGSELHAFQMRVSKNILIKKTWIGFNPGELPLSISLKLYRNTIIENGDGSFSEGTMFLQGITLDSTNNWEIILPNMDAQYEDSVVEPSSSSSYTTQYATTLNSIEVTNTKILTLDLSVKKEWNTSGNPESIPNSITAILFKDGLEFERVTLDTTNAWEHTFLSLDSLATYHVEEVTIPGFIPSQQRVGDTITLTNELELTAVHGTKTWVDQDNINNTRPPNIAINLYKNNETMIYRSISLSNVDTSFSFLNLPLKDATGQIIQYRVEETPIQNYQTTYAPNFEIINTYQEPLGILNILKKEFETNTPLSGAIFQIYREGDESTLLEATSDASGLAYFSNLKLGRYIIKEIKAPLGFTINEQLYYMDITSNTTFELIIYDKHLITPPIIVQPPITTSPPTKDNTNLDFLYTILTLSILSIYITRKFYV